MSSGASTPAQQTIVLLGNSNPQMQEREPIVDRQGREVGARLRSVPAEHLRQSVTRLEMQPDFDDHEHVERALTTTNDRQLAMIARLLGEDSRYAIGVQHLEHVVDVHSAGRKPDWVASSDPEFARVLSAFYEVPATDFHEEDGRGIGGPTALFTNAGRDALHAQHLSTSAQPATFNFMALANSATATAPAAGDTTLTGEITTAGGGLIRKQGTYAHTAGTNTSTITATFTANGTDALPVTVSQDALFNAGSAGTMAYKDALNANATFNVAGDNLTNTHTITGG